MFAPPTAVRRAFAGALAVVLVTSGCAAGRDAQTQNQVPTQDGTNANAGTMALRGVALVSPSSGSGFAAGSSIPMRLVLINNGTSDDRLTDIVTSAAHGWSTYASAAQANLATVTAKAATTATAVTVPAGQRVSYGVPDSKRVLVLLSSVGRIYPGSMVKVTFTFAKAGSVTTSVPVQLTSKGSSDS